MPPLLTYMPGWAFILTAGLGSLSVILATAGYYLRTAEGNVATTAIELPNKKKKNEIFILYRISELLGRPYTALVLRLLGVERQTKLRNRIEAAGRPDNLTIERYAQRKAGDIILYTSLSILIYAQMGVMAFLLLSFIFLLDGMLWQAAQERQEEIQRQLPDFLDVLAVTVGAGLSFRQALERSAQSMPGVLAEEFRLLLRQMDLGTPRREAFNAMRLRNSNEALGKFISALQQSEELGAPLGATLTTISEDMRRDDAQFMRQKAQKLNPRVTAVSAGFLLPGIMILIVGAMIFGMGDAGAGIGAIFG